MQYYSLFGATTDILMLPMMSTLIAYYVCIDIVFYVFFYFFLTEFLPKCYAVLLMAFDRHTIKVYLLTYLNTRVDDDDELSNAVISTSKITEQ